MLVAAGTSMLFKTIICIIYGLALIAAIALYRKTHIRFYAWLAGAILLWAYADTITSPFSMLRFVFGDSPNTRLVSVFIVVIILVAPNILLFLGLFSMRRDSQ